MSVLIIKIVPKRKGAQQSCLLCFLCFDTCVRMKMCPSRPLIGVAYQVLDVVSQNETCLAEHKLSASIVVVLIRMLRITSSLTYFKIPMTLLRCEQMQVVQTFVTLFETAELA